MGQNKTKMKLFPSLFFIGGMTASDKPCIGVTSANDWKPYKTKGIYVDVDISHCGFDQISNVMTSITCEKHCWRAIGINSIYKMTPESFRIYLRQNLSPEDAANWNYQIHYVARGDGVVTTEPPIETPNEELEAANALEAHL